VNVYERVSLVWVWACGYEAYVDAVLWNVDIVVVSTSCVVPEYNHFPIIVFGSS